MTTRKAKRKRIFNLVLGGGGVANDEAIILIHLVNDPGSPLRKGLRG